jgi:hypothetical protein
LIVESNLPREGPTAMTAIAKGKASLIAVEALLGQERGVFKQLLRESLQENGSKPRQRSSSALHRWSRASASSSCAIPATVTDACPPSC